MEEGSSGLDPEAGEELFWRVFRASPIPMCVTRESDGSYAAANDAFHRLTGFAPSDIEGKTTLDAGWADPADRDALMDALRRGNGTAQHEGNFVDKSGRPRIAGFSAQRMDLRGEPHLLVSFRDITSQRESESALRESEGWLRALFDAAFDAIVIHDGTVVLEANTAAAELFGGTREEVIGMPVLELTAPGSRDELVETLRTGVETPYTVMGMRKDGTTVPVEIRGRPLLYRGHTARVAVLRDLTEKLEAKEALRSSEARMRTIVEQVPGVLWTTDRDLIITYSEGASLPAIGLRSGQLVGHRLDDFLGPDTPDLPILELHSRALAGGSVGHEAGFSGRSWTVHVEPLRSPEGEIVGTLGMALDITDQRRAESDLERTTSELGAIFEAFPDLYFRMAADGTILDYQAKDAADVFDPTGDLTGKRFHDVMPGDTRGRLLEAIVEAREGNKPSTVEYSLPMAQGDRHYEARILPLPESELLAIVRDVTERQKAEEETGAFARRLAILHEIDQAILAARSPEEIARDAVDHIRELVGCERASVVELDATATEGHLLAVSSSLDTLLGSGVHFPRHEFGFDSAMRDGRIRTVSDTRTSEGLSSSATLLKQEGMRSMANIPLMTSGGPLGALNLASVNPGFFTEAHLEIAQEIANELAVALHQSGSAPMPVDS